MLTNMPFLTQAAPTQRFWRVSAIAVMLFVTARAAAHSPSAAASNPSNETAEGKNTSKETEKSSTGFAASVVMLSSCTKDETSYVGTCSVGELAHTFVQGFQKSLKTLGKLLAGPNGEPVTPSLSTNDGGKALVDHYQTLNLLLEMRDKPGKNKEAVFIYPSEAEDDDVDAVVGVLTQYGYNVTHHHVHPTWPEWAAKLMCNNSLVYGLPINPLAFVGACLGTDKPRSVRDDKTILDELAQRADGKKDVLVFWCSHGQLNNHGIDGNLKRFLKSLTKDQTAIVYRITCWSGEPFKKELPYRLTKDGWSDPEAPTGCW